MAGPGEHQTWEHAADDARREAVRVRRLFYRALRCRPARLPSLLRRADGATRREVLELLQAAVNASRSGFLER